MSSCDNCLGRRCVPTPVVNSSTTLHPGERSPMSFPTMPGAGGLPKVTCPRADGARVEVYLHGAHVTSWLPAGEIADRLFLSASSQFASGAAIRGGVPVCFPQFADQGPLPMHGFARVATWELVESGRRRQRRARAVLAPRRFRGNAALWPHAFAIELTRSPPRARRGARRREHRDREFHVHHGAAYVPAGGRRALTFVRGLQGAHYRDKVLRRRRGRDRRRRCPSTARSTASIAHPGHARSTRAAPHDRARGGLHRHGHLESGRPKGRDAAGPGAGGYAHMLCVEAAAAASAVMLQPEQRGAVHRR